MGAAVGGDQIDERVAVQVLRRDGSGEGSDRKVGRGRERALSVAEQHRDIVGSKVCRGEVQKVVVAGLVVFPEHAVVVVVVEMAHHDGNRCNANGEPPQTPNGQVIEA